MIGFPGNRRIMLASQPIDFRNYVESAIMLSLRRRVAAAAGFRLGLLRIIVGAAGLLQHGEELVGSAEPAGPEDGRRHGGKRLEHRPSAPARLCSGSRSGQDVQRLSACRHLTAV